MQTTGIGTNKMIVTASALTRWNVVLAMLPPVAVVVVVLLQRWFVQGLAETEKGFRCHGPRGGDTGRSF